MRNILILVVAVLASGCGSDPVAPSRTYNATLTVSSPLVGSCADVRCAYTAVVTNSGPDCAAPVHVVTRVGEPPFGVELAISASSVVVLRPNTSVQVTGSDWPVGGFSATTQVSGTPIACP